MPLRHAPYADGPADFAIGLRPIAPAVWLEGEEADPAARKDPLFETARHLVWGETEGSRPGQQEALELVAAATRVEDRHDLPPLYAAARCVADDLCLMEKRDGAWTLTALSLSAGSFFTAAEALDKRLDELHGNRIATRIAGLAGIEEAVTLADLVIGAVLQPGAAAPKLVDRATVARMKRGAVVVDVAIDQGGCFATSRPTSHSQPTFVEEGVVHYCVTNMPGAVARTATLALTQATLPHVLALADQGWRAAVARDAHLRAGLNVVDGAVTCRPVAEALGLPWRDPATL